MNPSFLFERQRLLLALLDAMDKPVLHTDFQKLLFLFTREWEVKPSYDFVPYHFGGFSFTSHADKRRLIERGLLVDDDEQWSLSEPGRAAVRDNPALRKRTQSFVARYGSLRGDNLIAEVYRRHPYYATRSRIAKRVLTSKQDLDAVAAARPAAKGAGLVTIGYEGKSLEAYLNQLIMDSVTLLCDVRRNPISRKYGFSKKTLSHACAGVGLRYEHVPELGIASEERRELSTQADYDSLFAGYVRDSLPLQQTPLQRIRDWVREGERVALTCYEALPCQCHRHCVAEALVASGDQRVGTVHHL